MVRPISLGDASLRVRRTKEREYEGRRGGGVS